MNYGLDDQHVLIRETTRDFAENEIAPRAEEFDRTHAFPYDIIKGLAGLGFLGIPFPEEYGGAGGDTLGYALAVEELARIDSSVAITVAAHTSLGTSPIWLFGSEEQRSRWVPPLASGEMLGAFGLTEPDAGSDAGGTLTSAKLEDGHWVVNGTKCFITNAGTDISGVTTVTAVTGVREDGRKEISCILVPRGTPGFTQAAPYRKMCWHGSDTRELSFVDCRVPAENLLGEQGRGLSQFLRILDGGRIAVGAIGLGLAQGAYEMALQYSRERCQFRQPIGRFQSIAFKLADMATRIEAARLLLYKAARLKDAEKPFKKTAAMAKLMCSELAVWAADEAVQIHGGYGVMDEYPVSRFYRDAKILTIGEGTNEIQRLVISREIGAGVA
ncbi:MAG: acyl-CoA dehydrogenase family protein [Thermoleophilia bacterium]|nr:acyl-CoA dehydrogenase family protein [Thermoleophilia bacterium]